MFETLKNLLVEELQLNPDEITLESDLAPLAARFQDLT